MVSQKKKLAFYSILSSGHLNVCASLGVVLLNRFADKIDVYFIVDSNWQAYLAKIDSRFKFGVFEYDKPGDDQRLIKIVEELESTLSMNLIDKGKTVWRLFIEDPTLIEVDAKSEEQIKLIQPDFLLCDQCWVLPAMINSGCPYGFITSTNPLILDLGGFPSVMSDLGVDEIDKINAFDRELAPFMDGIIDYINGFFEKRNSKFERKDFKINQIRSDDFIIYSFPKELDYYSEELQQKYHLWQIDTPIFPERVPAPYKLPKSFEALPGRLVYLSLGSLFSAYTHRLQKILDILDKLPDYKYIVSKGPNGDRLVFPSDRFIGENWLDQLGVLQVVAAKGGCMIAHGGNNTLGECFYFGVPVIVTPIVGDQIANAKRVTETGYGYSIDLRNLGETELAEKLEKLLNDEGLRRKWTEASRRIQSENRIGQIAQRVFEYINQIKK